jgi:hypothetical protein
MDGLEDERVSRVEVMVAPLLLRMTTSYVLVLVDSR